MSLMNIQLRHIRSFLAVAAEKSFVRASEGLAVSQPALSQTIQQLEETLGLVLFDRTTRTVNLTAEGALLLSSAQKLSRTLDAFYKDIRTLQSSVANEVRVGYLIGTAVDMMPDIVREFERRRPNATIHLVEFDFYTPDSGLVGNLVDCAIIRPPVACENIQIVEIAREPCVVCLPSDHTLAAQDSVRIAEILNLPIIAAPGQGVWRDYWLANAYREGTPPQVVLEAATVDAELQAVATRKGISITAESTAKYYSRPGVVFRPIVDMAECTIGIGYRDTSNPLVQEFVSVAKDLAQRRVLGI
ncbi:LysR Transcriptional regulator [Paracoccaceae bacterium]